MALRQLPTPLLPLSVSECVCVEASREYFFSVASVFELEFAILMF
jgi:hypothetical protein